MDTINNTGSHLKALQHHILHVLQHPQYPAGDTLSLCTDEAILCLNYETENIHVLLTKRIIKVTIVLRLPVAINWIPNSLTALTNFVKLICILFFSNVAIWIFWSAPVILLYFHRQCNSGRCQTNQHSDNSCQFGSWFLSVASKILLFLYKTNSRKLFKLNLVFHFKSWRSKNATI